MRAVHAILALLLTAPVLGASALDPPEVGVATTPPAMGTDDTCLARVVPPEVPPAPSLPVALPCADLPVFVDEGGDTMGGDLAFDSGFGVRLNGNTLRGQGASSLVFGNRNVCLAGLSSTGCITAAATPLALSGSSVTLGSAGCVSGEAWLWSGSAWSCDNVATQAEQDQLNAALSAKDNQLTAQLNAETAARQAGDASHQSQLNAVNNELDQTSADLRARLDAQAAQLASTASGLNAHRSSGDHDARYAPRAHDHGFVLNQTTWDLSTGNVAARLNIAVPDACPGEGKHRYLVRASGWLEWRSDSTMPGTALSRLVADERLGGDWTVRTSTMGYVNVNQELPHGTLAWEFVLTVEDGAALELTHLLTRGHYLSHMVFFGALSAMHLGWTCA